MLSILTRLGIKTYNVTHKLSFKFVLPPLTTLLCLRDLKLVVENSNYILAILVLFIPPIPIYSINSTAVDDIYVLVYS